MNLSQKIEAAQKHERALWAQLKEIEDQNKEAHAKESAALHAWCDAKLMLDGLKAVAKEEGVLV